MKNAIFWDVTLRGSCKNWHFGGTSLLTRATQRHIPEDGILQSPPWKPKILHHFSSCNRLPTHVFKHNSLLLWSSVKQEVHPQYSGSRGMMMKEERCALLHIWWWVHPTRRTVCFIAHLVMGASNFHVWEVCTSTIIKLNVISMTIKSASKK
jgi:hypothetical protein